jgi:3-phytase/alkaline phosphatase D
MAEGPRFATFNASLNRTAEGALISDLSTTANAQARAVAEIIQRSHPDVVLINEFDFDSNGTAARLFQENYLGRSQNGAAPVTYPYVFSAPSNTGIASGFDLDNNGSAVTTPGTPGYGNDAFGFGDFPGQFGMLLLSKYPIVEDQVRTFQKFLWQDMPGALLPDDPATPAAGDFYSADELAAFRLSSKSHWDVPVLIDGQIVHVLASHPTPPVFDGPEDRNGTRNHDEIRFWSDYVTPGKGGYIYDDAGHHGGLGEGQRFVIMGDQNADPFDGDQTVNAIQQLLGNPRIDSTLTPSSGGAVEAAVLQGGANATHLGNPAFDTADFADTTPGNLRADYVLPSTFGIDVEAAKVFWPTSEDPLYRLTGKFPFPSSDHRLVYVDAELTSAVSSSDRKTIDSIEYIGQANFLTGSLFGGTQVGGLSGLSYDPANKVFYALSDDRSEINPARSYTLTINLGDGKLNEGDVVFTDVTTLKRADGTEFPARSLDPEGIALTSRDTLFVASEGDANALVSPFVNQFSLSGRQFEELPVPQKFLPTADKSAGIRNNLAFESLTLTPDQRTLFTATENALFQDGPAASLSDESPARILRYDLATGQPAAEYVYVTDPVGAAPVPAGSFATNGLVELLALDNTGTLLALERGFSSGVGNAVKLYEVLTQPATDVSTIAKLDGLDVDAVAEKRLVLDFADLGIPLDNLEAMALGPKLADGRQSLIVVSDNNFSGTQITQVLGFAVEIDTVPAAAPSVETPSLLRIDPAKPDAPETDPDDPAIWVNATDPASSRVVTALKDAGLEVYDLAGQEVQSIAPDGVRYNNVDIVYGFTLDGKPVDLAVASDRANDTLAIFSIDPVSGALTDVTAQSIPASIFGFDDGERTAYGLASYTSPVDGRSYVFVSQREGAGLAQLELKDAGGGTVSARTVRALELPVPTGDPEDSQSEGIVIDRETGALYVGIEAGGLYKFSAEPNGGDGYQVIHPVDGPHITADLEGLTIYYGANGAGYLIASSQGDSSYAVFSREGTNEYLGSFVVGPAGGIDGAEETDGLDVVSLPLGTAFPQGLLVVQDGSDSPQVIGLDDDGAEVQNFSANFKFVPWQNVASAFTPALAIETTASGPRAFQPRSLVNGVAAGDTDQTSTVLWTRSTVPGQVTFELATDPQFSTIVRSVKTAVTDPNVPVKAEVGGLNSGTAYYYRATDAAGAMAEGRFATADVLGTHAGFSLGVSGDWRGELAPYPAVANAAAMDLDLFVALGDTIYADVASPGLLDETGAEKAQAETLAEYGLKHAEVYGSRFGANTIADLRASTSVLATIDDHEVTNDFSGGADVASDARFTGAAGTLINDTPQYDAGLQAFQDWNPVRDQFYGATGDARTEGERQLYRFDTWGSDAATFVLDNRSFRDGPLNNANLADPADVGRFLVQSFDPSRTMLGRAQLDDLRADLLKAQDLGITWKFVMVPEPIQNLGPLNAADRFEGYSAERTELLAFIDQAGIDNVVFVAADVHGTVVNNLTYQTAPLGAQIATSAFEITTGAVAYDAPLAFDAIDLATAAGLVSPQEKAFFDRLPIAPDADTLPNDKDDFFAAAVNRVLDQFGYDHLGLADNLPAAAGKIDATLVAGDWVAASTYGWTKFDIDATTQKLTVTTYGIEPYTREGIEANPDALFANEPMIVSQFVVDPAGALPLIA